MISLPTEVGRPQPDHALLLHIAHLTDFGTTPPRCASKRFVYCTRKRYCLKSPYKVLSLLVVAKMFETTPQNLRGWYTLFEVPRKPPSTDLKNEIL